MAEGPSIVLLKERAAVFEGRKIVRVEGDSPIAKERLRGQRIVGLHSHGKHFIVQLPTFSLRIHLLMLGSYCIDERKDKPIRLGLGFADGREINFYSCSAKFVDAPLDTVYDWRVDVMAAQWDAVLARKQLRALPAAWVCDALLDQTVFAGVGNVVKNEILFRIRVHPLSTVGALPPAKLRELVLQARRYTFEFHEWKKADAAGNRPVWQGDTLQAHWLAHNRKTCPRCHIPLVKAHLGELDRRSFSCERCQRRYAPDPTGQTAPDDDPVRPSPVRAALNEAARRVLPAPAEAARGAVATNPRPPARPPRRAPGATRARR